MWAGLNGHVIAVGPWPIKGYFITWDSFITGDSVCYYLDGNYGTAVE